MDISVPDDEPAVEKPEDPLLAKRIRDYFKTIKQHKTSVPHTTLLESGQTHGEFCICYLQTLHKRRQNNTMQKKTKDERRFQNTSLERFQNTGVLDQEEPIESGDDNDNSDDDEEINKVICWDIKKKDLFGFFWIWGKRVYLLFLKNSTFVVFVLKKNENFFVLWIL